MFESNSRCTRGQGLKMKVPGCGVSQEELAFSGSIPRWRGGHDLRFLYSLLISLQYEASFCGGEFWRQQLCEKLARATQAACQLSVLKTSGHVIWKWHVGMKTSGHVIFRQRSHMWPHLAQKVLKIFFLTWLVSFCITALIKAMSKRNSNHIKTKASEWFDLIALGYVAAFPPPASHPAPIETSPVICESLSHRFKNVSEKLG